MATRPTHEYLSRITTARTSTRLPDDLDEKLERYASVLDSTEDLEAKVRWMLDEYLAAYEDQEISREQYFTSLLVGLKQITESVARRLESNYRKGNTITPEQLIIIFKLLGDMIDKRVSSPQERKLLAGDVAALVTGHTSMVQRNAQYSHPRLTASSAADIINDALP